MKKHLNHLLAAMALFCCCHNAAAQSDSLLDLGRIKIDKNFAQTVTIKGEDLEKMPFDNLADAIAPWFQGAYTNAGNLVYVVDGNFVNDVNAWSIYDIEEITLVQNSMVRVNGALKAQQLVLVKTKRSNSGKGLTVYGNSALVRNKFYSPSDKSESNFYHQYHVTAWKNLENVQFGLSANFLRDVNPARKSDQVDTKKPWHVNRYRFNGWVDASLARGHSLSLRLNFVPQSSGYDYRSAFASNDGNNLDGDQIIFNPSLKLTNTIARGLTNELDISYLTSRNNYDLNDRNGTGAMTIQAKQQFNNLLIRDRLAYQADLGDWQLVPALNFTYRSLKTDLDYTNVSYSGGMPVNTTISTSKAESKAYILTPSVSFAHRNSFYLIGGISTSITDDTKPIGDGVFPFASMSVDVLRIGNAGNPYSLKIFGSYSKEATFGDVAYRQPGATPFQDGLSIPEPVVIGAPIITSSYPEDVKSTGFQLGTTFSLPNDRLQVSYNYDDRQYVDQLLITIAGPSGNVYRYIWPDHAFQSHRLGILSRLVNKGHFQWTMGLNATTYQLKTTAAASGFPWIVYENNAGENLWTGGFTNRLQCNNFVFGLDLLYLLNEQRPTTTFTIEKVDNWRINNIYVGYKTALRSRPLELYVNSRGCLQNDRPGFVDNRIFYGAGFKLQF